MPLNKKGISITTTAIIVAVLGFFATIVIVVFFSGGTSNLASSLFDLGSCQSHGGVCSTTTSCTDQVRGGNCPDGKICCKDEDVVSFVNDRNSVASLKKTNEDIGYSYAIRNIGGSESGEGCTEEGFNDDTLKSQNLRRQTNDQPYQCTYLNLAFAHENKFGQTQEFIDIREDESCTYSCKVNRLLKLVEKTIIKESCDGIEDRRPYNLRCQYRAIIFSYNLDEIERSLFRYLCYGSGSRLTNLNCLIDYSLTYVENVAKEFNIPLTNSQINVNPDCVSNAMCSPNDAIDRRCIGVHDIDEFNQCEDCAWNARCSPHGPTDNSYYNTNYFESPSDNKGNRGKNLLCCVFNQDVMTASITCPDISLCPSILSSYSSTLSTSSDSNDGGGMTATTSSGTDSSVCERTSRCEGNILIRTQLDSNGDCVETTTDCTRTSHDGALRVCRADLANPRCDISPSGMI